VDLSTPATNTVAANLAQRFVSYDSTTNPGAVLHVQASLLIQGTLDAGTQVEGLTVYRGAPFPFLAQLVESNGSFTLGGANSNTGAIAATTDVWYSLEMDLDFQSQIASAYVDGVFLASIAFASSTTSLGAVQFGGFTLGNGSNVVANFDDLTVSADTLATPEPGSLALFGLAGGTLAG
jgi:hypothetical protein